MKKLIAGLFFTFAIALGASAQEAKSTKQACPKAQTECCKEKKSECKKECPKDKKACNEQKASDKKK